MNELYECSEIGQSKAVKQGASRSFCTNQMCNTEILKLKNGIIDTVNKTSTASSSFVIVNQFLLGLEPI